MMELFIVGDGPIWATLTTSTEIHAQCGDIITIEGVYQRRTFWQWLFRRPRKPKTFTVQP